MKSIVDAIELDSPLNSLFYQDSNRSIGAILGRLIYPAHRPNESGVDFQFNMVSSKISSPANRWCIDYQNDYHILTFSPNAGKAEYTLNCEDGEIAIQTGAVVHSIEMPGVGNESKGNIYNQSHLIKAAILQVEYLISEGADPEKIILFGRSLGGATSVIAAAHLHSAGKKVSAFNDRSFSTLSAVVNGMVIHRIFQWIVTPYIAFKIVVSGLYYGSMPFASVAMLPLYAIAIYTGANSVVKIVLKLANWEMNAGDAYLSIPKYYKMLAYTNSDLVLGNIGGLYQVLREGVDRFDKYRAKIFDNHNEKIGGMTRDDGEMRDRFSIKSDFIHFVKEVQVRNEIKDFVIEMCAKVEDGILSGKKFELEDKDLPDLLKQHKASVNAALTNAQKDVQKLIEEYKAEQDRGAFIKGLRAVYNSFRNAIRKIISFVYNLHEAKGQDKYLHSTKDLADKIVETSLEHVMDALSKDEEFLKMIDGYKHENYVSQVDSAAKMNEIEAQVGK